MTLAELCKQEGREEERIEGKLEGKIEGKIENAIEVAQCLLDEGSEVAVFYSYKRTVSLGFVIYLHQKSAIFPRVISNFCKKNLRILTKNELLCYILFKKKR